MGDGPIEIIIRADAASPKRLATLFGGGVGVDSTTGCSLRAALCDQLGINNAYFDDRVQTLFLNGKAVDDVDTAQIGPGDTVALSASMPGLVGATMRKGGRYAVLRDNITLATQVACELGTETRITIKLFNLIAPELAPLLLANGVYASGDRIIHLMDTFGPALSTGWEAITLDGETMTVDALRERLPGLEVKLTVLTGK
jgi:hypothetical protein